MEDKNILKQLAEQKLKAFAVGNMGKRALTKKEIDELRKREEDKAAAHVFQEFVNTFQDTPVSASKTWVKAGTYIAGTRKEDTKEKGQIYKPQLKLMGLDGANLTEKVNDYAVLLPDDGRLDRLGKKREKDKKKSNLELFKEELKQIQEEREERHKCKGHVRVTVEPDSEVTVKSDVGSFDNGDPNTTNLYLGNLSPKITEAQLIELFGKYGPLASIKIMWPRSEEEKSRGRNCGFVAFMNRKDGERALRNLNGNDIMGYEMKLGWGKCVPIPEHPIYIPPALQELSLPPPPSGLPFNAQTIDSDALQDLDKNDAAMFDKILSQTIVKVTIPTDRSILCLIHRTIEFVIREGPMFEAVLMNREINNSMFRFLFDNQSPQHIYYRWKLYSMMQGDTVKEWRTADFRMFKGGSVWRPPPMIIYTEGIPDHLIKADGNKEQLKGALSDAQRDRLEELLRNLTPERIKIAEATVFAIEHCDAADEICRCILESLGNVVTTVFKKIARLYLISDILHNSTIKIPNASNFRRCFEVRLVEIFRNARLTYLHYKDHRGEGFKLRVGNILSAWRQWGVFTPDVLQSLENVFFDLNSAKNVDDGCHLSEDENGDGLPIDEDELDVPFDGQVLLKGALKHGNVTYTADPEASLREDADGMPFTPPPPPLFEVDNQCMPGVTSSRWETVDPQQVEAQAMTTSKWDQLDTLSQDGDVSDSSDGALQNKRKKYPVSRLSEDRRKKLREVEVKAVQYQDELEASHRTLKSGWSITQQVEHYRQKLLRKVDKKFSAETKIS